MTLYVGEERRKLIMILQFLSQCWPWMFGLGGGSSSGPAIELKAVLWCQAEAAADDDADDR